MIMNDHGAIAPSGIRVLLIAGTHGSPAERFRLDRVIDLARELADRGSHVDAVLVEEKPLDGAERDRLGILGRWCRDYRVVPGAQDASRRGRLRARMASLLSDASRAPTTPGGSLHFPATLERILHRNYAPSNYAVVIVVGGAYLARALTCFPRPTLRLLDLPHVSSVSFASHESHGRADAFVTRWTAESELRLLELADFLLVQSTTDVAELRSIGFRGDALYSPFPVLSWNDLAPPAPPIRPPRILCVTTESTAGLDGLRWFRTEVFPRVVKTVPSCRLRIVGSASRLVAPGDAVDRVGWVDTLDREYAEASVVVLPLRFGSGVRQRAVEALVARRALATTSVGAYGLRLRPFQDAVIADFADPLAVQISRVLTIDRFRQSLEESGHRRVLAERGIAAATTMLWRILGLPLEPSRREAAVNASAF